MASRSTGFVDSSCDDANASRRLASRSVNSANSSGDDANASGRLASVVLDQQQFRFTACENTTAATAKSMAGFTMSVSFWMAEPPGISFFSVHCSRPPNYRPWSPDFAVFPHVVGAEGSFVLLRATFCSHYGYDEYFMYKACDGESPTLEPITFPDGDHILSLCHVNEFGIVLQGQGRYLLAAICKARDGPLDYQLRVYSSETKTWSTRTLIDPCGGVRIVPEKVITFGEGVLAWVDFSSGLLVCDLRRDPPGVCFIPLPVPLPQNRGKIYVSDPGFTPRSFRDLTCVNGVVKFIEMEHREIDPEKLIDPTDKDFLYDSDLIMLHKCMALDKNSKQQRSSAGWRAVIWSRTAPSNYWRKESTIDIDDISCDDSIYSQWMSWPRDQNGKMLQLRDLFSTFPILSMDGDDILYLKSVVKPSDRNGWVVAVDLGNKTLKALGVYFFEHHYLSKQSFRPCMLSRHLNMTPGIEVSACCKITQRNSSANDPEHNASIPVDKPLHELTEERIERLFAEHAKRAPDEAQNAQNGGISNIRRVRDSPAVEETQRLRRMLTEMKRNVRRKEAQSNIQNDHIARVHSVQTNLPPQKCFRNHDGPCGLRCAPLTSITNLHGQPLWQQPPPLQQQMMPQPPWQQPPLPQKQMICSSALGPQEAPQPCLNKWDQSIYHGYPQQTRFLNSNAYGARTDYGNC